MRALFTDVAHAARALRRRPLLPAAAVGALALGIGASTAVFSVVDAVLLRPLPFARPDRLLVLGERNPQRGHALLEVSYPNYRDWRAQARTFVDMAILPTANHRFTLGGDEPSRVEGRLVSGNFFEVLGAAAGRGRVLEAADDRVGATRVAVLSDGYWRRQFGADEGLLGRTILLDGTPTTVVGVMPPAFAYPRGAELWIPFVPAAGELLEKRNVGWTMVLGRLADGATAAQAAEEMDAIVSRLEAQHVPAAYAEGVKAAVRPLPAEFLGTAGTALPILLAAVVLVLLLACANVSALLLARAGERRREMALRLALGASRARLVRGLLAESGLLALAGGLGGVLLSTWILGLLRALVPADVPRLADAAIDARVLAFALVLTAGAALLAGLAPASMASKPSLLEALADGSRTAGAQGHPRLRTILLAGEAAAVLVLLAGAGLLIRTFENLRRVDLGYDARQVLAFELSTPPGRYTGAPAQRELYRAVLERIDALPGVEASAGVLLRPLWSETGMDWPFQVEGQSLEDALRNPLLNLEAVTSAYFQAMRIPILRGRAFEARDADGAEGVVIVSEAVARRYWPGQEAVGKRLKIPLLDSRYDDKWLTVVGVAANVRYRELATARLDLYMSNLQSGEWLNHVVVRTAGDPLAQVPAVRAAVRSVDPGLAMSATTTMEAAVDEALGGTRFRMQLLSAFALAALMLAALGIYGVVAFVVGHRTREIGLRIALGAGAGDVARLVLRGGLQPVLAGLAAGLAAALVLARALSALLFGVEAHDPATLAAAAAVLAVVALLACAVPAARAMRVDPAVALRDL